MSLLFEPGPWDRKTGAESAHVFSKKRKLLYGRDHDQANPEEEGGDSYGERERHKMHNIWRKGALRSLTESARAKGVEVRLYKEQPGKRSVTGWPGDLGKHHAVVEELIGMGVLTVHADDQARTYALVHRDKLRQAVDFFATQAPEAPGDSSSAAAAADVAPILPLGSPGFVAAATFSGARPGYVFKTDSRGLGYYIDGPAPAPVAAEAPLPEGWVQGASPEGYVYYHHVPTGTSSWERPVVGVSQAPSATVTATLPVSAVLIASLTSAGRAGLNKIEADSGAQVLLAGGALITLSGTTGAVERAKTLLERKASALDFIARSRGGANVNAAAVRRAAVEEIAQPNYSFAGLIAASAPPAAAESGAGALGLLGEYGDSDGDDAGQD
jgi:hypothetical protein